MGFISDIISSYRKMKGTPFNSIAYGLFEKDERLFTFRIYNSNMNSVERYIIHVHKCQIDDVQKLDQNMILFSVIDENLKAKTLILKREEGIYNYE